MCHSMPSPSRLSDDRGGQVMTSRSGRSTDKASAGRPSVTRLIQRICRGSSGSGKPKNGPSSITHNSPAVVASMYLRNFGCCRRSRELLRRLQRWWRRCHPAAPCRPLPERPPCLLHPWRRRYWLASSDRPACERGRRDSDDSSARGFEDSAISLGRVRRAQLPRFEMRQTSIPETKRTDRW